MFPLCMRKMHHQIKQNHHLKHNGRMQYGLFLKGIGLSLDDALQFWRSEFLKKMDAKTFDQEHEYNIRHNYGKKGHSVDYSPYGCGKIINTVPASGTFFFLLL